MLLSIEVVQNAKNSVAPFLIGVILLLMGIGGLFWRPKKINAIVGYRTPQSVSSQEKWDFAQLYATKMLLVIGACLIALFFVESYFNLSDEVSENIGWISVVIAIVVLFVSTEIAMKKLDR